MAQPFIVALCPTYRRPELLANSVALWERQDYPADRRRLLILDDGGSFDVQSGQTWALAVSRRRVPSLPAKYDSLLCRAAMLWPEADAFLVWEDDDVYLPEYVRLHAEAFARGAELSKPAYVLTDYTLFLPRPAAALEFHSSVGFSHSLALRTRGWPVTDRADFDRLFLADLETKSRSTLDPFASSDRRQIPFVKCELTGAAHGGECMHRHGDTGWYTRAAAAFGESPYVGRLVPRLDDRTQKILAHLRDSSPHAPREESWRDEARWHDDGGAHGEPHASFQFEVLSEETSNFQLTPSDFHAFNERTNPRR